MMISPEAYIEHFEDAEYLDLIKERDRLMQFITQYEEKDIAGDRYILGISADYAC